MQSAASQRWRRREGARALVLGHRGARHAAPENTQRAFELARTEGADGIELDVRLSRDGQVIVLHDPNLSRVTRGACGRHSEDLSFSELRALDVGEGERVPLLEEVLAWAVKFDLCVNVELKSDVRERRKLVERVIAQLALRRELSERVLLSSFHPGFVRTLARALPTFAVNWLVHAKQRVLRHTPGWQLLGASGVNLEHVLLSASRVNALKQGAALIGTWTVNDPRLAVGYDALGVDVIISDCPAAVLAALTGTPSSAAKPPAAGSP